MNGKNQESAENRLLTGDPPVAEAAEATTTGKASIAGPRERLHRIRFFVFFGLAGDMMFFAALVVLFFARQAGIHMDPRSHEMIGDWHPIMLPPIVYLNTAILLLSSLAMEFGRRNIFREIDVLEEWLGLGRPALRRTLALGRRRRWRLGVMFLTGQAIAWRQLTAAGIRLRPLVDSGQLLLLPRHRTARRPPGSGRPGARRLPVRAGLAQESGVSADRRRCHRMVLAHAGSGVDSASGGSGGRTIVQTPIMHRTPAKRVLASSVRITIHLDTAIS